MKVKARLFPRASGDELWSDTAVRSLIGKTARITTEGIQSVPAVVLDAWVDDEGWICIEFEMGPE